MTNVLEGTPLGDVLRDAGIATVSDANRGFLSRMRSEAVLFISLHGSVTAADLHPIAAALGLRPTSPNAWGAVFRDPRFAPAGLAKNPRPSAHARRVVRWKLAPRYDESRRLAP